MEGDDAFLEPSDVAEQMPRELDWQSNDSSDGWVFWSRRLGDELDYQLTIKGVAPVFRYGDIWNVQERSRIKRGLADSWNFDVCLTQFWALVKVNGSIFLSNADQPFGLSKKLDKRLCEYRRLCLNTLIPLNDESILGRAFTSEMSKFSEDVRGYSVKEFPLLEDAIRLGIRGYRAMTVFDPHYQHRIGVFEFAVMGQACYPFVSPSILRLAGPRSYQLLEGLRVVRKTHNLPFAQIWIRTTSNALITYSSSYDRSSLVYHDFAFASRFYGIASGQALVGRAFSSQGSCFCRDVTSLRFAEYPLLPSARTARLTGCFAICLRDICCTNIVYVVECFLPPGEMVDGDVKAFLNMLLSTIKEQFSGFLEVASGKELGQTMLVEVVKASPWDELGSFEIGQSLPGVQRLQRSGAETTETNSLYHQSDLQNPREAAIVNDDSNEVEKDNVETMPSDLQFQQPNVEVDSIDDLVSNGLPDHDDMAVDVHSSCERQLIDAEPETMSPDLQFQQPNVEVDFTDDMAAEVNTSRERQLIEDEPINEESNFITGSMNNVAKINSQRKKNKTPRAEKDYGITREILEQHFGMSLVDAAKDLHVSRSTLKRICREFDISRWPHPKTRKICHREASKGVSSQCAEPEPYAGDQQCPDLTGKPCDSMMTVKVTYRGDIIKFKLAPSSTRVELEGEVESRLSISLQLFSIKYQDEDDDWILITSDSDLRDGMQSLRSSGRTTMKLVVTPKSDA